MAPSTSRVPPASGYMAFSRTIVGLMQLVVRMFMALHRHDLCDAGLELGAR